MKKTSVLPEGMTLEGDIEGVEDLAVFGRVDGSIQIDAALVIEGGGTVRGDVRARTVTVKGILVGDAHAEETVWVEDGARVIGDLVAPRVKVMDGARFRGRVRVLAPDRPGPVVLGARPSSPPPPQPTPTIRPTEPPAPPRPAETPRAVRRTEPPTVAPARPAPRRAPVPRMPSVGRVNARRRVGAGE